MRKIKKEKIIGIVVLFIVLISLCSCTRNGELEKQTIGDLSIYNTPYTKCEKNADGTYDFYIYAAPMQYQENEKYNEKDLSIVESDDEAFAFMNKANDIKTYYPDKITRDFMISNAWGDIRFCFVGDIDEFSEGEKTEFENLYGDIVSAVKYKNSNGMELYCYSTISGIQLECICKDNQDIPKIDIETDVTSVSNQNNGYIILNHNSEKSVVIYNPIVRGKEGEDLYFDSKVECKKKGGKYRFTVKPSKTVSDKDIRLTFSIEKYVNKMPDSAVYSGNDKNSYLCNYAIIGEDDEYGIGMHYIRFRLQYYLTMNADNVLNAQYYVKNLNGASNGKGLSLCQCLEQWSSTQLQWKGKPTNNQTPYASARYISDNWIEFDVSQFVKECFKDETWSMESLGSVMMCDEGKFVVATSDNSLYVPYMKITMKELPDKFSNAEDVNPPAQ